MATVDSWLEGFMHEPSALWVVLLVSLLLGLRHASDPDHLAAVTTLIASDERKRVRKATFMGFAWGLGHGTTLILIGLPPPCCWDATCRSACSRPPRWP